MKRIKSVLAIMALTMLTGCNGEVKIDSYIKTLPPIFPDYTNVTVPPNISPLNFSMPDSCEISSLRAVFVSGNKRLIVKDENGQIALSNSKWKMLKRASSKIIVTIQAKKDDKWIEYSPFTLNIANDSIDSYIVYRLIEPGYETWNEMGIYQRNLEDFEQSAIITNKMTAYGCMNCHSFCKNSPEKMLFHMRSDYGGTYIVSNNRVKKLNTKTPQTISALVYPSWHPSGNYIAFSVNNTKQMFHTTDKNRIEVFDNASDVVVYDVKKDEIVSSALLMSDGAFETFPTFSPDGKRLYFCSADSLDIPAKYDKVKYSLCSISFDEKTGAFGDVVDTLYNAHEGKSVSFPRVSPDGKYLMFTLSAYGNFSIWHKDADLYLANLKSKKISSLKELNSEDTESYHSWSSNGRWVVFSSRRVNGLYTHPFIAYFDKNGKAHKPFLLPQKDKDYYAYLMKSYNIPEFVKGKVDIDQYNTSQVAKKDKGIDLKFRVN